MNILAIDTATEACSVAVSYNGNTTAKFELAPQKHSQLILPMIDEVLSEAGITLSSLDCIAFGRGPGSFTGVRIATGIVQGLAYGSGLPVVGVSTMQCMAQEAIHTSGMRVVAVAIDARMGEVYRGLYINQDGIATELEDESVVPPEAAFNNPVQPFDICAGTGWQAYPDKMSEPAGEVEVIYPNALYMLPLAEKALRDGKGVAAQDATPVYVRDTVTWKKLPGR